MLMDEKGGTVQLWLVADGRSDVSVPLRSAHASDAHLTLVLHVGSVSTVYVRPTLRRENMAVLIP